MDCTSIYSTLTVLLFYNENSIKIFQERVLLTAFRPKQERPRVILIRVVYYVHCLLLFAGMFPADTQHVQHGPIESS